jgi:transcriptional regulator with PAS, ATPase and Fis domain
MSSQPFSQLNPINFLQTFVTQSLELSELCESDKNDKPINKIEQLGLNAGSCFEAAYREERGLAGPLDRARYRDLIVEIKNKIGGSFSAASSEPGMVRVINTRCPFGEAVKQAPELCKMTSSVFGGIAAHNFGYAKVILEKRIAVGDGMCEVCIHTDPNQANQHQGGDEYRKEGEVVLGKSASAEVGTRVEKQMNKVWCGIRSNKPHAAERPRIVAQSPGMRQALETVEIVAPTTASILISGETGVGKEVVARAIHAMSERWNNKFLAVNCGAIPENLVESVLFGHERGAFTGAYEVHQGFFERAEKGTLFLDEIDSLPLPAQARLLRVLQENEFERVGGKQSLSADVRIVAAGSQLDKLIAQKTFRLDLYYRLNVVPIHIPPLRERSEDIPPLAVLILTKLSEKYRKKPHKLGRRALSQLMSYDWPGNVRELENILERSFLFASGEALEQVMLPKQPSQTQRVAARPLVEEASHTLKEARKRAADEVEEAMLKELLISFRGNIKKVAQSLHITPRAVHQKLTQHRIDPNAFRLPA